MLICTKLRRGQILSILWLLLLPVVDGLLVAVFSPQVRSDRGQLALLQAYAFTVLATLIFWAGVFLLVHQVLLTAREHCLTGMRLILRFVTYVFLVILFLYFFLLWTFIVTNGHLPNPESIVFLMDNMGRVPQHLLQTSPLLVIAILGLSLATAMMTELAISIVGRDRFVGKKWRIFVATVCALAAWHVMTPLGLAWSPAAFALNGTSDERLDARAKIIISELGPKSHGVATALPSRKFPVIVILVESLRYDLLKTHPEAVPFLKSLNDQSISFDYSYATASHSNLTDLAFWYSQYPLRGAGKEIYPVNAPWRGTSMFRAFKDAGYQTAYISSQNERWGNMLNWLKTADVDYFFDSESYEGNTWENYDDLAGLGGMLKRGIVTAGKVEDSQTLEVAKRWLAGQSAQRGFFLGMNLQNTHFSYVIPPNGVEPYQPSDLDFRTIYYRWPENKKVSVRNRYLNAVTNVDRMLERFADYLKKRGMWEECLFVVVGDNGEAFYEHGFGNHSGPMYDEAVRTFSVIKPPQSLRLATFRVTFPISHIDIAATVPALAGIGVPESFQGLTIHPSSLPQRPVYMYSNAIVRQYGLVAWPWKFLVTEFPEAKEELYRLDSDPGESVNLALTHNHERKGLSKSLGLWMTTQKLYYGSSIYTASIPPQYLSASLPN